MMASVVTAVAGFLILAGVWFGVQSLVRSGSGCRSEEDMLEGHGCGNCDHSGQCRNQKAAGGEDAAGERKHHDFA